MTTIGIFTAFSKKDTAIFGLKRANRDFVRALIKYGHFDKIHVFNLLGEEQKTVFKNWIDLSDKEIKKVEVFSWRKAPQKIKEEKYYVIHKGDPNITSIIDFRDKYSLHNFPITGITHTLSDSATIKLITGLAMYRCFKEYDVIICSCKSAEKIWHKLFDFISQKIYKEEAKSAIHTAVIPLGVHPDIFKPQNKQKLRQKYGFRLNEIIITCVGRLTPKNKMELQPLLLAFKKVCAKAKKVRLLIIGQEQWEGYTKILRKKAKELKIENKVTFKTDVPLGKLQNYYALSDIFVSPSDHIQETYGLTPVEAMSCGLPVVVSDWNGYRDTVIHGKTGYLVPTYWADTENYYRPPKKFQVELDTLLKQVESTALDINKMVEYLLRLVEDKGLREKMGQAAREHVLKNYSWEDVVDDYKKLAEKLNKMAQEDKDIAKREKFYASFFDIFKHYSTKIITFEVAIESTPEGGNLLATGAELPVYKELHDIIFSDLACGILECAKTKMKIKDVFTKLEPSYAGLKEEELLYHIMYLLKHGYLNLGENSED